MPSTITLQNVINFVSTHADLLPLANVGGFSNEPGLSICNDAISDLISDPNDWIENRVEMPFFMTCANKQDYMFAGADVFCITVSPTPSTVNVQSMGWAVDLASNNAITVTDGVVTLNTLETHRFSVGGVLYANGIVAKSGNGANAASYNSTFTDDGTYSQWNNPIGTITAVGTNYVQWDAQTGQNNGDILGAPGITNFGYLTSGSLQEVNNNSSPPNVFPLYAKRELPVSSHVAQTEKVSVMVDYGNGILKIRLLWVPSWTVYAVNLVYQAQAPVFTSLTQTWAPFPDKYGSVIRQAVIYRTYRYLNDPKADAEYQKLEAAIAKAHGTDEGSPTDVQLVPETELMQQDYWGEWQ
jgi:hypothetical protein